MKNENWSHLESMLRGHGFWRMPAQQQDPLISWFACSVQDVDVTAYLRFVFKPKFRILTAHLGWRHEITHNFILTALESDWPRGFSWLSEAGVLDAPCLSLFNLADYLSWPLAGMPIGEPQSVYEEAEIRLSDAIERNGWTSTDAKTLLSHYVDDEAPFTWRSSNSAIRLAQIAGLCVSIDSNGEVFERSVVTHAALIETDMYGLGSAANWIAALRTRLARQ